MGHYLYFVRHGQTVWNVENKICGATDIPLTELGRQQAMETGRAILDQGIHADEILYSPLERAADTARYISEITGIPARAEHRLTEQNFGKWESTARDGLEFRAALVQKQSTLPLIVTCSGAAAVVLLIAVLIVHKKKKRKKTAVK